MVLKPSTPAYKLFHCFRCNQTRRFYWVTYPFAPFDSDEVGDWQCRVCLTSDYSLPPNREQPWRYAEEYSDMSRVYGA